MSKSPKALKPLHGPFVPDPSWVQTGFTTHVPPRTLWLAKTERNRPVPLYHQLDCPDCNGLSPVTEEPCIRCDMTGKVQGDRVWKLHPLTKEPIYKMNKPEFYIHERLFYMESDGLGQQVAIDWRPPSEEEIAAKARGQAVDRMVPQLSEVLVDSGLSASDIGEALKQLVALGKAVPKATPVAPEATEAVVPISSLAPDVPEPAMAGSGVTTDDPPPKEL